MIKDGAFLKTSCGSPNYAGTAFFELLFLELLFLELLFFEFFFLKTSCGSPNYAETLQFFFSFFPITMQALEMFFEKKLLAAHPTMQALQFVF